MNKLFILAAFLFSIVKTSFPQVLQTKQAIFETVFSADTEIERNTIFLTEAQVQQIEKLAKSKVESKMVNYYIGKSNSELQGYVFFDTHIIRTMPETFVVVINPDGDIDLVEILAFYEPKDYLPPKKWLKLFNGKSLSDDMRIKREIPNISGATISTNTITSGIRRILATFQVAVRHEKEKE